MEANTVLDSVFIYVPNVLDKDQQKSLMDHLNSMDDFKDNHNYVEDKIIRQQKWYHLDQTYFCPEWKYRYDRWTSHVYDQTVLDLQKYVQDQVNQLDLDKYNVSTPNINSCLINKYRDGSDYIRPHKDTELTFGDQPTIVGLSIGHTRDIVFASDTETFKFTLESGSMFIMAGRSQQNFTHEIPRSDADSVRYSLTFRAAL